jgi:hypothetical protein
MAFNLARPTLIKLATEQLQPWIAEMIRRRQRPASERPRSQTR